MKKIALILFALISLTSCWKWFGNHPKPTPSPYAPDLNNLKGKWTFYSDTVVASSGNLASAITHDYNDLPGYYYKFITDSTGFESLGTEPNSEFGFTYKLKGYVLTLTYFNVVNNPNFKLPLSLSVGISDFLPRKMVFSTSIIDSVHNSSTYTRLRLTK
ncbi:MAG: hypothetical protein ACHQHN_01095 [Sphingobacteriales bacterium]